MRAGLLPQTDLKDQTNCRMFAAAMGVRQATCFDGARRDQTTGGRREDHGPQHPRRPLPHLALARRLRRDAPEARLLGGLRRPPHRLRRERPRPDLHERAGNRGLHRRRPRARAARGRAHARRHHRGHARLLALARVGRPAPLARAGEGRHPSRRGRGRQRRVGSLGEGGGPAALAAPDAGSRPRSSWRRSTSATSRTRCRRRRRSTSCARRRRARRSARRRSSPAAIPPTPRPPAGSDTRTRRSQALVRAGARGRLPST